MFLRFSVLFFWFTLPSLEAIFCADILEKHEEYIVPIDDLKSLKPEEIIKCIPHLGKLKFPVENARVIWSALVSYYGDAGLVPEETLQSLRWTTVAIEPKHYENMTLSSIDVIENFGLFYDLSQAQLSAIAERVKRDWGGKTPEDYTSYDLIALRQILCAFDSVYLRRIHAKAYKDAAKALGTLKKCPHEVLSALASLAVKETAFGRPDKWRESTLDDIGVVVEGLPRGSVHHIPIREAANRAKINQKLNGFSHSNL